MLKGEYDTLKKKEEEKAKKAEKDEEKGISQKVNRMMDEENKEEEKEKEVFSTDKKFEELKPFKFLDTIRSKTDNRQYIVEYEKTTIPLWEIFGSYGTKRRPKKKDNEEDIRERVEREHKRIEDAEKKLQASPPRTVQAPPLFEGDNGGSPFKEGEVKPLPTPPKEEEPDEYEETVDKVIYYDFVPHNGKDPILLSLLIKREGDKFTL